jgi:hypothetical protein
MTTHDQTTSVSSEQTSPFVGYICSFSSEENTQLGVAAYLCVDEDGSPLEFLRTDQPSISDFTKILYGGALPRHALEKAVGAILKGVGQRPKCVFVSEECLLRPNPSSDLAVVLLQDAATSSPPLKCEALTIEVNGRRCQVAATKMQFAESAKELLAHLKWDPLEPFERIRSALRELKARGV